VNPEILLVFIIVAFSFGLILIMKKDTIPERIRRPLSIFAIFMVTVAFGLMIYSFFI